MNSTTILVTVLVAVVGPLFAYLAAARKLSGKIQTSEASSLWQEASNLRSEYRDELKGVREQLSECLTRIKNIEELNSKLKVENGGLNKTVKEQAREIENLKAVVFVLEEENKALKRRVLELEAHNGEH